MVYVYTKRALKDLKKLPKHVQRRIVNKLDFIVEYKRPLYFLEHLKNPPLGNYRIRIGDIRIICDVEIILLRIGHRRFIYK